MSANTIVAFSNTKPTYFLKNFERPLDFNQVLSTTEFPSTERLKDGFGRFMEVADQRRFIFLTIILRV